MRRTVMETGSARSPACRDGTQRVASERAAFIAASTLPHRRWCGAALADVARCPCGRAQESPRCSSARSRPRDRPPAAAAGGPAKRPRADADNASSPRRAAGPPCPRQNPLATAAAVAVMACLLAAPAAPERAQAAAQPGRSVLASNTLTRRYLVTDSSALLRYSLPLDESSEPPIRNVQALLERIGVDLKSKSPAVAQFLRRDLTELDKVMQAQRVDMLLQVPAKRRLEASQMLSDVDRAIASMETEIGVSADDSGIASLLPDAVTSAALVLRDVVAANPRKAPTFDANLLESWRDGALGSVARLEEVMVADQGFPFRIPRRYDALPRLEGRAQVEFLVNRKATPGEKIRLVAVLDGYSAPLNAGNFIDLVRRGVYSGATIQSGERGFYLQVSDKAGAFVDPGSGQRRTVPMEVMVVGERSPVYGYTLDEAGAGDLQPALPVTAYGALASYHSVEDPNDASSQWYIFLFDPRSYEARSMGGNALNGSVSCFGYITEGKEKLAELAVGDEIVSARLISGLDYFRLSADSPRGGGVSSASKARAALG